MRKSRLKKTTQYKLIEHFVARTTARCAASLVDINPKNAVYYFMRLRELIFLHLAAETSHYFDGEIEVDESYFGGSRKGKHGGKVYAQIIPDEKTDTLMPLIQGKVKPDSIVYSDCWPAYNTLDTSGFSHFRINRTA